MIPAQLLHRLVSNIIDHATALEVDVLPGTTDAAHLDRLIDFAREHHLDAEDMATLFRVAAGESFADPVVMFRPKDDPGMIVRPT